MQEGSITPLIAKSPNISLDESIKLEFEAMKRIMTVPGVERVVSRLGRGESPADPGQPFESDPIVTLKPLSDRDLTQEEIDASMVLNKRNIERDAKSVADLVFASFSVE
jgi:cobalt-zinc-cadmium resistance protein CzcA